MCSRAFNPILENSNLTAQKTTERDAALRRFLTQDNSSIPQGSIYTTIRQRIEEWRRSRLGLG